MNPPQLRKSFLEQATVPSAFPTSISNGNQTVPGKLRKPLKWIPALGDFRPHPGLVRR